jgi:hypothetical protein
MCNCLNRRGLLDCESSELLQVSCYVSNKEIISRSGPNTKIINYGSPETETKKGPIKTLLQSHTNAGILVQFEPIKGL